MSTTPSLASRLRSLAVCCAVAGQAACIAAEPEEEEAPDAALLAIDAGAQMPPIGDALWLPDCGTLIANLEHMREQHMVTAADDGATPMMSAGDAGLRDDSTPADEPSAPQEDTRVPVAPGQVVFTEIMADPSALADTAGEWIELHNTDEEQAAALQDCVLDDGGTQRLISDPLRIAPGGFATIARTTMPGFVPDAVVALSLTNGSDALALRCDGVEIDRVAYDSSFPLAAGVSMALDPNAMDADANDSAAVWCLATQAYGADLGTPGAPNTSCFDDAGVN